VPPPCYNFLPVEKPIALCYNAFVKHLPLLIEENEANRNRPVVGLVIAGRYGRITRRLHRLENSTALTAKGKDSIK